jgi:hypothetical protein
MPGQLRGPECRAVMPVLVDLRRQLEPLFTEIASSEIRTVGFVLRVGGTLGEFEELPSRSPEHAGSNLAYDVVVPAEPWDRLAAFDIRRVICLRLRPFVAEFLDRLKGDSTVATAILDVLG